MWKESRQSQLRRVLADPVFLETGGEKAVDKIRRGMLGQLSKPERKMKVVPGRMVLGNLRARGERLAWEASSRLWEGDRHAWPDFHRAWRYAAWAEAIELASFAHRPNVLPSHAAAPDGVMILAAGIALGEREFARLFVERLLPLTWERKIYDYSYVGLHPLLVMLTQRWFDSPLELQPPGFAPLGPYAPLIDQWDDCEAVASTMQWMCDDRVLDLKVERLWQICRPAIAVDFPAEIHCIFRIRSDCGAATKRFAHPVLEPPFDSVPTAIAPAADDLLADVAQWAKKEFPILSELSLELPNPSST